MHTQDLTFSSSFTVGYQNKSIASVLDEFSITRVQGRSSITVLSGSNGSGKTTLLRALGGVLPPLSGWVSFAGIQLSTLHQSGQICYLPETLNFLPHLTPEQIINSLCAEARADFKIAAANINLPLTRQPFWKLSKGNRQKVRFLLACMKAKNCSLVLLDEPFSGFDIVSRNTAMELLAQIFSTAGRRLIISLHTEQIPEGWSDSSMGIVDGHILPGPAFHSVYEAQKYFSKDSPHPFKAS